jgi:UDP-N-acetyl-D-mannosaminuronate dehydrogenase
VAANENGLRRIGIIGDQPEALFLAVLFAEAGVSSTLAGPFEPLSSRGITGNPLDQARRLLALHLAEKRVVIVNELDGPHYSMVRNLVLTSHMHNSESLAGQERLIRTLAVSVPKGANIIITGLCRPGHVETVSRLIERMGGLRPGTDVGICYLPLLWDGEGLGAFRETPRILAGSNQEAIASVQELFFKVFPSLTSATNFKTAEAAGLFMPVFREVSAALELELAGICVGEGVDYSDALGLCRRTGLGGFGSSRLFARRSSIASEISASLGDGASRPSLIRAARRVNEDLDRRVMAMVKGALARCGLRIRHSRIAVLGLDGLGAGSGLPPEPLGLLQALNRRGAVVSVYPGSGLYRLGDGVLSARVRVEHSMAKAVERAQCAVVALEGREVGDLDPHRLAAEMTHPAALCDLTGVLEASNVERAGLFYASMGRAG